jgi:hypothetical protein
MSSFGCFLFSLLKGLQAPEFNVVINTQWKEKQSFSLHLVELTHSGMLRNQFGF